MATMIKVDEAERLESPAFGISVPAGRPVVRNALANARRNAVAVYSWSELAERFASVRGDRRDDRIILYRHGATNYNVRNLVSGQHDTALSDDGRRQARSLRSALPPHIDLIVCSALSRAVETMALAVPAGIRAATPIIADPRLNEVHLGILQGRRRRHLPEFEAGDLDFAPPRGETYRDAAGRVFSAVADVFALLAGAGDAPRTAAVFCHAGVLRIVATLTSGSDDPKDVFRRTLGNAESLEISSSAVRLADYWGMSSGGK